MTGSRPVTVRRAARTILAKDLRVELRTLESVPAMAIFAVTVFVVFRFALDRTRLSGELAAGVLVVTLLFAAVLAVNRIFVAEREQHGFDGIRLAPIDLTALLWAKAGALGVYQAVLALFAIPVFGLFFLDDASSFGPLAGVVALTLAGLSIAGTLVASLTIHSRARDVLTPLILLPMVIPLLIASASAAEPLLREGGPEYERFGVWMATLALYDLVVALLAWAVFDFIVED